jgi:hypothetical protein
MRARNHIFLCCVALVTRGTAWSADLRADFRHKSFDNAALKLVGQDAEQFVMPTERGLLIQLPPKLEIVDPIGIAPRMMIRGDFEIIAEFELLRYDWPREGPGVGVGLVVDFPAVSRDPISIQRLAIPKEGDRFTSSGLQFSGEKGGRAPARSRTGKLRLVRTASTVRAYYADGNESFRLLGQQEVGEEDARITRFGAEAGSKPYRVEAILNSLTVSAGELVEPPKPVAPSTTGMDPAFLCIVALDIVLIGLATWRLWPRRSGNPSKGRVRS